MMSKIEIFFRSKAVWSLIVLFIIQGITAIQPQLSGNIANITQGILAILTFYFHPTEVKTAALEGTISGTSISEPLN